VTASWAERILIIGGTSGIGLAAAQLLTERGAHVTVTGRDPARAAAAGNTLGEHGDAVSVDAGDRDAVEDLFHTLGPLDHLVVAASGGSGAGPFRDLNLTDLRSGFDGKLWPQLIAVSAALPRLRPDGSITLITAISAQSAEPGTSGLAAINGALEAMIPTLAVELAPLRVNAVSPGVIDTTWWDFLPADQRAATFDSYARRTPAGRVGQPADVADAIAFLIGNTFTTGVVLACDGGLHLA